MTPERYACYLVALDWVRDLQTVGAAQRDALADAAEAFLLARSPAEAGLDHAIDSASWVLTDLNRGGGLSTEEASDLWEAICQCGPPGVWRLDRGRDEPVVRTARSGARRRLRGH
jgi:hypothetical protein